MSTEDSITRAELTDAFKRVRVVTGALSLGAYPRSDLATFPGSLAGDLFRDVLAHREPEYVDGKVYRDADGDVYQYDVRHDGVKRWYEPGNDEAVPFDEPNRPLRYLG